MGYISGNVRVTGLRKTKTLLALFDSGAYRNHMRRSFFDGETADDIGFHVYEGGQFSILADGRAVKGDRVHFKEMEMGSQTVTEPAFVMMEDLSWDIIIGAALMQEIGVVLDLPREMAVLPDGTRLSLEE